MGKKVEQVTPVPTCCRRGKYETWVKRETKRARRRAEKRDPESAPTKTPYRGWST